MWGRNGSGRSLDYVGDAPTRISPETLQRSRGWRRWLPLFALVPAALVGWDVFLWLHMHSTHGAPTHRNSPAGSKASPAGTGRTPPFSVNPDDPATVRSFGVPVLTVPLSYAGEAPSARAAKIVRRLNDCFVNDLTPARSVTNMRQGTLSSGEAAARYVFFGYLHQDEARETADVIVTVDPDTAHRYHTTPTMLACWWRDLLRDWLLIDEGKTPYFTTTYDPALQRFSDHLQAVKDTGQTPQQRFQTALASLIDSGYPDYESLRLLYARVPRHYEPHPDNYQPLLADDGGP